MNIENNREQPAARNLELVQNADNHPSITAEKESVITYKWPIKFDKALARKAKELAQGIPNDQLIQLGPFLTARSPETHTGPYRWAIDFLCPDGTPVLAAQDGEIIKIEESHDKWGDGPEFRDDLNYITLRHQDGNVVEYTQYCHLAKDSVSQSVPKRGFLGKEQRPLKVGSMVKKGQQIGIVGKTGWTDRDHLHFLAFIVDQSPNNPFGFRSIKPKF